MSRALEIMNRLRVDRPIGVEVGVATGCMSAEMLTMRPDLTLYMVDSWLSSDKQPDAYRRTGDFHSGLSQDVQDSHFRHAVAQTEFAAQRRTIVRATSKSAAAGFLDAFADFVFLDADHSYEAVVEDIEAWKPKLKLGGLLCGHDYDNGDYPQFGVKRAVDEAVQRHGWSLDLGSDFCWFVRLR